MSLAAIIAVVLITSRAYAGPAGFPDAFPAFFLPGAGNNIEYETVDDRPYPYSGTLLAPIDGKNLLSASIGILELEDDFTGLDKSPVYAFSYIRYFYDFLGFETTIQTYSLDWEEGGRGLELESGGVEFLLTAQPNNAGIQPYAGIGIGNYLNNLKIEENGVEIFDETDNTYGLVVKAGVRANVAWGLNIGAHAKYFQNEQDFDFSGSRRSLDLGGFALMLELGYRF